jgi:hypothetical protein
MFFDLLDVPSLQRHSLFKGDSFVEKYTWSITDVKNTSSKDIMIYLIMAVVLLLLVLLGYWNYSLHKDYEELASEYDGYKAKSASEISTLLARNSALDIELARIRSDLSDLSRNHSRLSSDYDMLSDNYHVIQAEAKDTMSKIADYENELQSSIEWFGYNSKLRHDSAETYLENKCLRKDDFDCSVKTGCFYLVNQEYLDLEYKYDTETSSETDKLQSLREFADSGGGDCEDYSLFFKAEWNYLTEDCEGMEIESWHFGDDPGKVYLDYNEGWYLSDASEITFEDYRYPNIVCGNMYDPNTKRINGHCVIALTETVIRSSSDFDALDNAVLIEPQNGMYLGRVNRDSSDTYVIGQGHQYSRTDSSINRVITDSDFYLYSASYEEWQSYGQFLEELAEQRKALEVLVD